MVLMNEIPTHSGLGPLIWSCGRRLMSKSAAASKVSCTAPATTIARCWAGGRSANLCLAICPPGAGEDTSVERRRIGPTRRSTLAQYHGKNAGHSGDGRLIRDHLIGGRPRGYQRLQSASDRSPGRRCLKMSREPDETLDVLRGVWSARGQGAADLDQATGHEKSCKRMANVGFQDMAEDDADVRTAWRDRLQREGKLNPEGGSLADLILGPAERR